MLNHIYAAFEQLEFTTQKRVLHIQFANALLNQQVYLQRIDGTHGLNQGLTASLICLSTHAFIPLKQFIGCQVAIDQVTDTGQLSRITGIITQAQAGANDGALTLYRLTLEDPTSLWKQRRNSRVFMNKNVVDVVNILFQEWQQKSPLFAASLSLDLAGLSREYDIRPFIMQSNESDYDFLTRLLRSEGISWLIDEAQTLLAQIHQPIQAQKLRLIDDNQHYQALPRRLIRFHQSSAVQAVDSIIDWQAQRQLQPTAVHVQRWQADALTQDDGAGSVQSKHQQSEQYDVASLGLEQAWHFSPAWMQDLNGEDGATASGNPQLEQFNQQLSDYYNTQAKHFCAQSTVRDAHVGYWFELQDHPEVNQHSGADKEFLITEKTFYSQNNLPKDLNQQLEQLLQQSHWQFTSTLSSIASEQRQGNLLRLQRRHVKTVPAYHPEQHRPAANPQRAQVVGPNGEEIHVDEWGRIKVRFLFTRNEDHTHDGGAGSNDNDTDSAWVDVLTPWAGEGYGARFLPRIGEIVVIDFFQGDIDRPFVVGRIHEAQRSPTKFDNAGQLPDTKKLAGIKSKEYQGEGFNQLRFDDTTGQISAQLQSSHAASQLNLGKLSHPKSTEESEDRGEGFELRTDQWGALRAGEGLLLSTYKQDQAQGEHLDAHEGRSQLEGNFNNAKTLSSIAKNQKTDEIESFEQLKVFFEQIEKDIGRFKKAIMLMSSPNSIGLSTSEDIHISADGQINQYANKSINQSTNHNFILHAQDKISLFAAEAGARLFAGKGKIELQAQNDQLDIVARKGVQIISTESEVIIRANKKIVLESGGSRIEISGAGIRNATGSLFEVKAGQHQFKRGEQKAYPEFKLPILQEFSQKFLIKDSDNKILKNMNYLAVTKSGVYYEGKTDEEGYTKRIYRPESEGMQVYLGQEAEEKLKEIKR
ncbi:type VI secretion system Vgr family protein [Acinetobacter sp. ANC 4173]|uniref:type VI secretion system Vgr family protein n=1 Tax=Acinetobacter sp. ANC 4173 TaxID=2529837 RepID=UPI00103E48C3|nr:type VI secretion system Vgr family protein [Acinetobacter sp. ANC 4173]TCB82315.1 type VI secretion system tip protein VgrG [Acinetobacter sp. ANC 4173]